MLTATYTLVALSVEQASVRMSLQSLQKLLHANFMDAHSLTQGQAGYVIDAVKRLADNSHWHKLDMYLIPAVRRATREADGLLQELDELAHAASDALASMANRFGTLALESQQGVAQFCTAIDTFCSTTLKRLEREERELFPVARAVISGEAWFSIANAMLAHSAYLEENRPAGKASAARAGTGSTPAALPQTPQLTPQPTPLLTH